MFPRLLKGSYFAKFTSDSHIKEQMAHLTWRNSSSTRSDTPHLRAFALTLLSAGTLVAHMVTRLTLSSPSSLYSLKTSVRHTLSEIANPKKYNKLVNMTKKEANLQIQRTNSRTVQWLRLHASTAGVMGSTPGQRSSTRLKVQWKKKKNILVLPESRGKEGAILG